MSIASRACKICRSAYRATDKIRACNQPQNREGHRHRPSNSSAHLRRRGDRIKRSMSVLGTFRTWAFWRTSGLRRQERPFPKNTIGSYHRNMEVGPTNRAGHYLDDGIAAVLVFGIPEPARTRERGASQPNQKGHPLRLRSRLASDLIEPCVPTAAKRAPMGIRYYEIDRQKNQTHVGLPSPRSSSGRAHANGFMMANDLR
jgi:hypothetical protein